MSVSAATKSMVKSDALFESIFDGIVRRFRNRQLTYGDKTYLASTPVTTNEFEDLTDYFTLRHGIELVDNRIELLECATPVHEFISSEFDYWIQSTYGRDLVNFRSASVIYQPGNEKQPDASFRPRNMPDPDCNNGLMWQPNTFRHFPTIVFEVTVTNESRNRLLGDANDKYFSVHMSVAVWFGVKIDLAQNTFWAGWGRRNLNGTGMRLQEQTEDANAVASYLPVYPYPPVAIPGQFTIPSILIYNPLPVPANKPANLVISIETLRAAIEEGIDYM